MKESGETRSGQPSVASPLPVLRTRVPATRLSALGLGLVFALVATLLHHLEAVERWLPFPLAWATREAAQDGRWVADGIFHLLLAWGLCHFLGKLGQPRLRLLRVQAGIIGLLLVAILCGKAVLLAGASPLWLPVAPAALWVAVSFERRAALLVGAALVLSWSGMAALSGLSGFDGALLCVLLTRAWAGTLVHLDRRSPRRLILAGAFAGMAATGAWILVRSLEGDPVRLEDDLRGPSYSLVWATLGAGLGEGLAAALFHSLAGQLLGNVSRERLQRLTDLEQPLLQRLAREAPGSYEHSRVMANLAEQAASAIGADALLTRVGAYYHDLGKTIEAKHFVENLGPGEPSPHDGLSPEESARRIVGHVVEGTRILREGGLPEPVVEFAYTHHGTQVIEYFWNKHRQAVARSGGPELDESYFRYPGMKPQTKETAILMLVDSIEAASRTIDPPDRTRFREMVHRVVQTKLEQGQLDESNLSLSELRIVQARMVETLVHMNHHRIKYPWQAEQAEQFGVPAAAVTAECSGSPSTPQVTLASAGSDAEAARMETLGRGARQ